MRKAGKLKVNEIGRKNERERERKAKRKRMR